MPRLLRISAVLTVPLLASLLAVAHAEDPAPATAPTPPTAPTCKKKVSKQVMSGGVVKTVMEDNGPC